MAKTKELREKQWCAPDKRKSAQSHDHDHVIGKIMPLK